MVRRIRLGTRPSLLALRQAEEIRRLLPHLDLDVAAIETKGDRDKTTPLPAVEATDFFTSDIEKALLDGRIDAAVHSAKDLEENIPKQLYIAAVTRSISPLECLVSRGKVKLEKLPAGSVVGTSSRKRKAAISDIRGDLIIKDIRGNVDERLRQLNRGDFDAVITAYAALLRLGYQGRAAQIFSPDVIEPHPLQGRLAVQVRRDRQDMIKVFGSIHEN